MVNFLYIYWFIGSLPLFLENSRKLIAISDCCRLDDYFIQISTRTNPHKMCNSWPPHYFHFVLNEGEGEKPINCFDSLPLSVLFIKWGCPIWGGVSWVVVFVLFFVRVWSVFFLFLFISAEGILPKRTFSYFCFKTFLNSQTRTK